MIPRLITVNTTCEELVTTWIVVPELAARVLRMATRIFPLEVLSGYRTADQQAELENDGAMTAPDSRSTHRSCPATGMDLWLPGVDLGQGLGRTLKIQFGAAAEWAGLRWGGGLPT